MTSRLLYEAVLIELRKENAPNILLEDFNYLANKSVSLYVNKRYNIYDINQQTTDDLRVLKATALLDPKPVTDYSDAGMAMGATYYVDLPDDYLHMLNCICVYNVNKTYKCYNKNDTWRAPAKRLTADAYSQVLDNFWNRPTYKKPYYYIHNINKYTTVPTDPYNDETKHGTDILQFGSYNKTELVIKFVEGYSENLENGNYLTYSDGNPAIMQVEKTTDPEVSDYTFASTSETTRYITNDNRIFVVLNNLWTELDTDRSGNHVIPYTDIDLFSKLEVASGNNISKIEKASQVRYGNASKVRCEIRYGTDTDVFQLKKVYIDYLKTPQHIRLTLTQLDHTEDLSLQLEFPDYVCQEIINELVHIIMENISDMRLLTHPVVSLSIANPAQQLTESVALLQPT